MSYTQIRFLIQNPDDNIFDILSAELFNIGYEGFNQSDIELSAFIPESYFDAWQLKNILSKSVFQKFEIQTEKFLLPQKNWNEEWEKDYAPVLIDNICAIIAPFHHRQETKYSILIEPKMSFGTGHHETTRLMIRQIYHSDILDHMVLDMGCGTGVLGIFSLQRGAKHVTAIDIDEWACENSRENFQRNNFSFSQHKVIKGDAFSIPDLKYKTILANINRNILLNDTKYYFDHLSDQGELIISGILKSDKEIIFKELDKFNLIFVSELYENNWISLKFRK
jgi:ribosomal protein L11 methyltransferase